MLTQREFDRLADRWRGETTIFSLWDQCRRNRHYKKLIDHGFDLIPFILNRLKTDASISWSMMLTELLGSSPYVPDLEGGFAKFNVQEFADAWIAWGVENGYITE